MPTAATTTTSTAPRSGTNASPRSSPAAPPSTARGWAPTAGWWNNPWPCCTGSAACASAGRFATTSTKPSSAWPAPSSAGAACGTSHFVRTSKRGQVIIESLEAFAATAAFAVVLLTGDDYGGIKGSPESNARARQNVVFELGFFIGALGRSRVAVLYEETVELPSDMY